MPDILLILCMTVATFATRYPVLALVRKTELPPKLTRTLEFVPCAILSAICLPAMIAPDGNISLTTTNHHLVAGALATATAWRWKNLLSTITVGMGSFLVMRIFLS